MKPLSLAHVVLLLCALSCQSASFEMPYHPNRKVGEKFVYLQPLYDWSKEVLARESNDPSPIPPRPLTAWKGTRIQDFIGHTPDFCDYHVVRVYSDGLVVEQKASAGLLGPMSSKEFFLENYPLKDKVADGDKIEFLAVKVGTHKIGTNTYELYDYGIPYDPWSEKQAPKEPKLNVTNVTEQSVK